MKPYTAPDIAQSTREKVYPLHHLENIIHTWRQQNPGKSVVLCHGVFDLFHWGHLHHLEQARQHGDLLVVSLTADKFVNKGPGRPVFTQDYRAELIAALACVDFVTINHEPTALPVIEAIQPNIYVKGSDYANSQDDLTGKILDEQTALEKHGGKIVFTGGETFSSSSLINNHLSVFDGPLDDYLRNKRQNSGYFKHLHHLISQLQNLKVVLVGETIIDEYQYVFPMGKTPKENMIATLFQSKEIFAGGVIAAANHIAGFCREVEIITAVGEQDSFEDLIRQSVRSNVRVNAITIPGVPTIRKSRIIDKNYFSKLHEVYYMDDTPLSPSLAKTFNQLIQHSTRDANLVVVTDFGHGLISDETKVLLEGLDTFLAINTQTNTANFGYNPITKYGRCDYFCIDAPEARIATRNKHANVHELAHDLAHNRPSCDKFIITHGRHGCLIYDQGAMEEIPAFTTRVLDTVGAGDAFLAITSPLVSIGADMADVGFIGNAVGALKVNIIGHRHPVESVSLLKFLTTLLK